MTSVRAARSKSTVVIVAVVTLSLTGASIATNAEAVVPEDPALSASGSILVVHEGDQHLVVDREDLGDGHHALTDDVSYSLVTDGGQIVAVSGEAVEGAVTGDAFEGELTIPDDVVEELDLADGPPIAIDSVLGEAVVDAAAAPLHVEAATLDDIPVANAFAPLAHTIDFAVVARPGSPTPTGYDTRVASYLSGIDAIWSEGTDGGISSFSLGGTTQAYVSAYACTTVNRSLIWAEAAARFSRPGGLNYYFNGGGHHLVVLLPSECATGGGAIGYGVGSIGTIHSGGLVVVSEYSSNGPQILAHEIGHNLGLGHSNLSYCGTTSYNEGSGCSILEYEDIYSVMGLATLGFPAVPALTAPQRDYLDGFPVGGKDEQPASGENQVQHATYTLLPISDASGLRAVQATDPLTGTDYYIELRSGTGRDAGTFYTQGFEACLDTVGCFSGWGSDVGVRVMTLNQSELSTKGAQSVVYTVVTNPGDPRFAYPALVPGEQFVSRSGGLRVVVNSMTPSTSAPTSASITVTTGGWTSADAAPDRDRISGSTRYDVGVAISQEAFPGAAPVGVPVVYVTNGQNYPDALSAAPAATVQGGPLLLTQPTTLPAAVRAEIERLAPARIVVVGGVNSVSAAVYNELATLAPDIIRLGGADRYEASRNIVRYAWIDAPGAVLPTAAYVATGANFPDALSASGAGGALNMPVILVNGKSSSLDAATRDLLDDLGVTTIKIAGGPNSVSTGIQTALGTIATTTRLSGSDRFDASKNIARDAFDTALPSEVFISTGYNFPDALAGAALAGARGAPLIVVQTTCIPASVIDAIDDWDSTLVTLLGGTASLTTRVEYLMPC